MSTNTNLSVKVGSATCTNVAVSQATKLAIITCTVPAGLAIGNYDVTVDIVKNTYHFNYIKTSGITIKAANPFDTAFKAAGKSKQGDYYKMQDMDASICGAVPTPTSNTEEITTQLIDTRDSKIYWVNKLKDGNCWMTQNLALGYPYEGADYTEDYEFPYLTPEDSDVTEDFDFYDYADENYMHYASYIPRWNGGPDFPEYAHWDNMSDAMQYGNYYNYALATAYSSYGIGEGVAPSSICPKGWRLPTAGYDGDDEFSMLLNEYNWDGSWMGPETFTNPPLSFGFPGFYDYNLQGQDNLGCWWSSSTLDSNYYAMRMYGDRDGNVHPEGIYGYHGSSIRCIARKAGTEVTITYDANGGSGAPSPTTASSESLPFNIILSSTVPTKSGQQFAGWNTEQDGSGEWGQPDGTLAVSGDTTLYAMWVTPYAVTYNANGGTGAPGATMATAMAGSLVNQRAVLSSTKPTKSGFTFAGWNTKQDGSGTWYQPGGTITVSSDTTLYAEWATPFTNPTFKLNETSIANITYMQEMNSTICSNMTEETQYQLKDSRDNKYYYVAKLKDGKCWMTQNLDLDLDSFKVYDNTNTNVASSWVPARPTIHTSSTTVSGWVSDYNTPYSADRGNVYSANGTSSSSNLTSVDCTVTGNTNCHYHIGNHYNWSAAVASNDTSSYTTDYTIMPDSICPKGWRLPKGSWSTSKPNDFVTLNNAYGGITNNDNTLRSSPLWFVRSGYVYGSSLYYVGSRGYYWSSTVHGSYNAYDLYFHSGYVNPTYNDYRNFGYSVRCIAQ